MSETWPTSIPEEVLVDGFMQQALPTTIRTKMEAGLDKLRRRYTTPILNLNVAMFLTFTQYEALENFYNTTLQGGVLSFDFTDPATDTSKEYRFLSPPSYTPSGGVHYLASMQWERI